MSLLHDALRRGQPPASGARTARTAQADSVLAALGYRAGRSAFPRTVMLIGIGALAALTVYISWAVWSSTTGGARTATEPNAHAARPARVSAPPVTPVPRAPASLAVQRARVPVASPIPTVSSAAGIASAPPQSTSVETVRPAASAATTVPARPYTTIVASGVARAAERRPEPAPARRDVAPPAAVSSSAGPDDFELGLYYQRTGNFEQALVHYQAVLARDELNLEAHNNLGRLYLEKGLPDDAIREFQRGVAIDPRYLKAHVNLAAAYFKLERYDMSAAESRAALAIDPRSVDALVNLALAQKASGQLADARESLLAALRIDQHNAAAHYNLARQYEDSGDAALARAHYESFLKYAGPDQTAYASDVRARIAALSARMK